VSSLFSVAAPTGGGTPFNTSVILTATAGPFSNVLYGAPADKYALIKFVGIETNYNVPVGAGQAFDFHIIKAGGLTLVDYAISGGTYTTPAIPAGPGNYITMPYNAGLTFGRELDSNFILLYPSESLRCLYTNAGNGFNKAITFSGITFGA